MESFIRLLVGTLALRPYVAAFLLVYLFVALADLGWRRTVLFTSVAWGVALAAEFLSIRVGIPFGFYHYLPTTADRELWVAGVPFMNLLSFVFLAYASWSLASLALLPLDREEERLALSLPDRGRLSAPVFLLSVVFFVLIDVVVDPIAVRGDRWFLGRIFYYPEPGLYFGVPVTNFVGWGVVGCAIMTLYGLLAPRVKGGRPAWAARLPLRPLYGPALYYLVLGFALSVTWLIGEQTLLLVGLFIHGPLTTLLVATVVARWWHTEKSSRRNLEPWRGVFSTRDEPVNGPGSLPAEPAWRNPRLE
jgi:putative membrane protein